MVYSNSLLKERVINVTVRPALWTHASCTQGAVDVAHGIKSCLLLSQGECIRGDWTAPLSCWRFWLILCSQERTILSGSFIHPFSTGVSIDRNIYDVWLRGDNGVREHSGADWKGRGKLHWNILTMGFLFFSFIVLRNLPLLWSWEQKGCCISLQRLPVPQSACNIRIGSSLVHQMQKIMNFAAFNRNFIIKIRCTHNMNSIMGVFNDVPLDGTIRKRQPDIITCFLHVLSGSSQSLAPGCEHGRAESIRRASRCSKL